MASVVPSLGWGENMPLASSYDGGGGAGFSKTGLGDASILCRSDTICHIMSRVKDAKLRISMLK